MITAVPVWLVMWAVTVKDTSVTPPLVTTMELVSILPVEMVTGATVSMDTR